MIPSIRVPQVLEGPRGSGLGDPSKQYLLLTDLAKLAPKNGEAVFLSPSTDLRILLRGAKTIKDRDGRVIGEFDPLEVKFEGGLLRTNDAQTAELLMASPLRGKSFYAYEDVVGMKDKSDEKQLEAFLSSASPEVVKRLEQMVSEKSFNLGKKTEEAKPKSASPIKN